MIGLLKRAEAAVALKTRKDLIEAHRKLAELMAELNVLVRHDLMK